MFEAHGQQRQVRRSDRWENRICPNNTILQVATKRLVLVIQMLLKEFRQLIR